MPDTKRRKSVNSQSDRISELPDDILYSIVSYFSVKDAANASLLSKRWRLLCSSISKLIFHVNTMFGLHLDLKQIYRDGIHACPNCKDIFLQGVNQFLQFYKSSQLDVFRVSFCLDEDSTREIDQWVSFAVSRGVKLLNLGLSCPSKWSVVGRSLYTLSSELLSHPNVAKMRSLFLTSCIVEPGAMNHLGALQQLTLANIPLGKEALESILCCCLNLESLKFICGTLPPKLCVISGSLQRLKFLAVLLCDGLKEIELSATNLTRFDYGGPMIKFSFSRVPKLKKVYFFTKDGEGLRYVFTQLAKDLPLLKKLSVHLVYSKLNWVQYLPKDIATFNNVKHLQLICNPKVKLDILRTIIVLKAFPLLEKLYLMINFLVHSEEGKDLNTKFGHQHLKKVHISGFQCLEIYIEFAKYMLESAGALEMMVIDPQNEFYCGGYRWAYTKETWGEQERQKVCEWLKDHSRRATIIVK